MAPFIVVGIPHLVATSPRFPSLDTSGQATLRNTIVAFNDGDAGLAAAAAGLLTSQTYCDVHGNTAADYGANVTDVTGVDGNLAVDPLFSSLTDDGDPLDDDWSLGAGSACIDAGDPSAAYDDGDGTRNDQGAHGGPYGSWP